MSNDHPTLRFHRGTLVWESPEGLAAPPPGFVWDDRIRAHRTDAIRYRALVEELQSEGRVFHDEARAYFPLTALPHLAPRDARDYQTAALEAWRENGRQGVVCLPTGAGKSYLAEMCMVDAARPTLIVVPTIDLLTQWHRRLVTAFGEPVGMLGGGSHEICAITVSTYASAYLHADRLGDRFGLVVFDEVHHLPAESYRTIAECLIAPFRLGLSATPEREDEMHLILDELVGHEVYRKDISEMAGEWLASYEAIRLEVYLTAEEQEAYNECRAIYHSFLKQKRMGIRGPRGWTRFIQVASRSKAGRAAMKGWRDARKIAHGTERKLDLLETLLDEEAGRRTLIFTDDNATAYRISREFLVPCITHQTKAKEREEILDRFERGEYQVISTSRVLNEGVDLPGAEVAVVVSGSGSVREHVQRLGRILRPGHGKRAVLYEMVTMGTSEERTSSRRREHEAYRLGDAAVEA